MSRRPFAVDVAREFDDLVVSVRSHGVRISLPRLSVWLRRYPTRYAALGSRRKLVLEYEVLGARDRDDVRELAAAEARRMLSRWHGLNRARWRAWRADSGPWPGVRPGWAVVAVETANDARPRSTAGAP